MSETNSNNIEATSPSISDFLSNNYYVSEFTKSAKGNSPALDFILTLGYFGFNESYRRLSIEYIAQFSDSLYLYETLKYGDEFTVTFKTKSEDKLVFSKKLYVVKITRGYNNYFDRNGRLVNVSFADEVYFNYLMNPVLNKSFNNSNMYDIINYIFSEKKMNINTSLKLKDYKYSEFYVYNNLLDFVDSWLLRFPVYFSYTKNDNFVIKTNKDLEENNKNSIIIQYIPQQVSLSSLSNVELTDNYFYSITEINPFDLIDDLISYRKFGNLNFGNGEIKKQISIASADSPDSMFTNKASNYPVDTQYKKLNSQILMPYINEYNSIDYNEENIKKTCGTIWDYEYEITTSKYNLNIFDIIKLRYLSPKYYEKKEENIEGNDAIEEFDGFINSIQHLFVRIKGKDCRYKNTIHVLSNSKPSSPSLPS